MKFEYDPNKSATNKIKHGIDFEEAQALWNDSNRLEIDANTTDEPRRIVIGMIGGKHWSAIVLQRNHNTRLISVRRSRDKEVEYYES